MREYKSIKISYFSIKSNISKKKEQETCKTQQKKFNICGAESQKKRSVAEATFREIIGILQMDERYSTNSIYWRNPTSPKQDDNRNHTCTYQAKTENQSKKKGLRAARGK